MSDDAPHPRVARHKPHDLSSAGGVLSEMGWLYRAWLKGWVPRADLGRGTYALSNMLRGLQIQEQLSIAQKGGALPFAGLVIAGPPEKANGKANGHGGNGKVIEGEATDA